MSIKKSCSKKCCDCSTSCRLDEEIPCSPDCENLTGSVSTGVKIRVKKCLEERCEEVKHIFGTNETEKIIEKYGEITEYPYL